MPLSACLSLAQVCGQASFSSPSPTEVLNVCLCQGSWQVGILSASPVSAVSERGLPGSAAGSSPCRLEQLSARCTSQCASGRATPSSAALRLCCLSLRPLMRMRLPPRASAPTFHPLPVTPGQSGPSRQRDSACPAG